MARLRASGIPRQSATRKPPLAQVPQCRPALMAGHTGDEDQLALVLVCRHGEGLCTRNAKAGATVDESGPKLTVARKMLADSLKSEVPGNLTGKRAAITVTLRSYQDRQVGIATATTGERRPGRSYVRCAFLVPDRRGTLR